jgi:hypothetical protein
MKVHLNNFSKIKSQKESQIGRNQDFSHFFCMVVEGSGSIPLTNGSGSGKPQNMWIRIRNNGQAPLVVSAVASPLASAWSPLASGWSPLAATAASAPPLVASTVVVVVVAVSSTEGLNHKVHIYTECLPQCMSPRRNWDSPNPSFASECAPPPGSKGGGGTLACGRGVGGVPIPTTKKA